MEYNAIPRRAVRAALVPPPRRDLVFPLTDGSCTREDCLQGLNGGAGPRGTANARSESMNERTGVYFLHGKPLTLVGNEVKAGDRAPAFRLVDTSLSPVTDGILK